MSKTGKKSFISEHERWRIISLLQLLDGFGWDVTNYKIFGGKFNFQHDFHPSCEKVHGISLEHSNLGLVLPWENGIWC